VDEVLKRLSGQRLTVEYKYDGERMQLHRLADGSIRIFSRSQEDTTQRWPELASAAFWGTEIFTTALAQQACRRVARVLSVLGARRTRGAPFALRAFPVRVPVRASGRPLNGPYPSPNGAVSGGRRRDLRARCRSGGVGRGQEVPPAVPGARQGLGSAVTF
jgi:hypothetical protein